MGGDFNVGAGPRACPDMREGNHSGLPLQNLENVNRSGVFNTPPWLFPTYYDSGGTQKARQPTP